MFAVISIERMGLEEDGMLVGPFGDAGSARSWCDQFNCAAKNETAALHRFSREFELPLAGRIKTIFAEVIPVDFSEDSVVATGIDAHPAILLKSIILASMHSNA